MQRLKETMSKRSKDSEVMLIFSGVPSHFRAKADPAQITGLIPLMTLLSSSKWV